MEVEKNFKENLMKLELKVILNGLRVTDEKSISIVEDVLKNLIKK